MNETTVEYRQQRFAAPPGATDILLIRHGESQAARPGESFPLVNGQGDPALHPNGEAQAERLGERLAAAPITAIYATSLRRTQQTAAPLAKRLNLSPVIEPDLREVHLGSWEGGLFRQKSHEQDPVYLRMHEEERWDVIPGAESHAALTARINPALNRIAAAHRNELIAVVVHGGVIAHILAQAASARPFAFVGADNGSISRLIIHDDRWLVRGFNDAAHLAEVVSTNQGLS
ncbi:MAG: histidine phosphatase family protein [Pseudomonadota bacterium]